MESIGNGTPENGEGLAVESLQSAGRMVYRDLSWHKQIHIKDKLWFRIGLPVALYQTGTGVNLDPAAAFKVELSIDAAVCYGRGYHIVLGQGPQPAGVQKPAVGDVFQIQCGPGKEIQIPQANSLEKCGPI